MIMRQISGAFFYFSVKKLTIELKVLNISMGRGGARPNSGPKKGVKLGPRSTEKKQVLEMFTEASPMLLQEAIDRAMGKPAEGKTPATPGDSGLLKELVKKALPDNININMELWTRQLSDEQLWAEIERMDEEIEKIKCCQSLP